MIRFNPDGSVDNTFGNNNGYVTDLENQAPGVASVIVQPDGKILVTGNTANTAFINRYNQNGSLDTNFGSGGHVLNPYGTNLAYPRSLLVLPNNNIIVGGSSQNQAAASVVSLNPDGTQDTTFGTNGYIVTQLGTGAVGFSALVLQTDGKILGAGFASNGSYDDWVIERYAAIANAAPTINPISNATINEGDTYTTNGSFTDPDSTSWTATVDYGDGSGAQPLTLSGMNFSLSHVYNTLGAYTVTATVTDNQGATGTGTATVTVVAPTTVTFDNKTANNPLNGTYAGINWGSGVWDVDGAITTDSTNSISFHTATVTNGTFSFSSPSILLSTGIYSNSNQNSTHYPFV